MKTIHIDDSNVVHEVLNVFHSENPIIIFQLPSVYTLCAPPTKVGIEILNKVKARLSGKNYGTAIGSLHRFRRMALDGSLPSEVRSIKELELLAGAFIRINIGPPDFNSPVARDGSHQGILLASQYRDLFCKFEESLAGHADLDLFCGKKYTAPLCTSANISGDPLGSITDWDRAYEFGRQRGVPLAVRCQQASGPLGSYPIFHLTSDKISIARSGPGENHIKNKLPSHLFK
jgi:tRNA A37 threonylcarbamoyladenosine synthetase subunit TsaC/SUA5/YrdC